MSDRLHWDRAERLRRAEQLTPDQIAEVQEVFSLFDKDGDGAIAIKELGPMLRSLGFNPSDSDIQKLTAEVDAEGNGIIDMSDFLTIFPKIDRSGETEEEVEEAFRVFDKETNGYISAADLRHIMTNMGEKLSEEDVDEMLMTANIDERGEIKYNDFITKLLSLTDY